MVSRDTASLATLGSYCLSPVMFGEKVPRVASLVSVHVLHPSTLCAMSFRSAVERAEYASFDVQAMITLELIDRLEGRPYARRFFGDNTTLACYEVDDFFDRTRPEMRTGAIREFDEETVVRYIKDVLVCEDRFQINYKAGVTIEIPWKKRTSSK